MEKVIQYLRELHVIESRYRTNLENNTYSQGPDDMIHMQSVWQSCMESTILPAPWQEWTGKRLMVDKWLAYFDYIKIIYLPLCWPLSQLWRNWFSSLKKKKLVQWLLHLYRPVFQPLEVCVPLHKREDIESTHHVPSCGFTCVTMESLWGNGMEKSPWPYRHSKTRGWFLVFQNPCYKMRLTISRLNS